MELVHPLLGTFTIVKKIGDGTFASVYLANHLELQYPVAIKIFHNQISEDDLRKALYAKILI